MAFSSSTTALHSQLITTPRLSTFFIDAELTPRCLDFGQRCAIESALLANGREWVVYLLARKHYRRKCGMKELLRANPRLYLFVDDFGHFFSDTFLETWYRSGRWNTSEHRATHVSFALRYLASYP